MTSVMEKNLYTRLADLLEYPKEDIKLKVEECIKALLADPTQPSEAVDELKLFLKEVENTPLDDLQGVYSYTFELSTEFTLDLGSHLFEGFKRANMLASLKAMYRENGFPFAEIAKGELPDRLPVLLNFLGFSKNEELKKDIRHTFVIMALEKLRKNFERSKGSMYKHLINSIYRVLEKDVKEA